MTYRAQIVTTQPRVYRGPNWDNWNLPLDARTVVVAKEQIIYMHGNATVSDMIAEIIKADNMLARMYGAYAYFPIKQIQFIVKGF